MIGEMNGLKTTNEFLRLSSICFKHGHIERSSSSELYSERVSSKTSSETYSEG